MRWHKDPEVDRAFIRLIDSLCTWERNTFRGGTLVFIPDTIDHVEQIIFVQDGKPLPDEHWTRMAVLDAMKMRLQSLATTARKNNET